MKKVIGYTKNTDERLKALFESHGIGLVYVQDECLDKKISDLFEMSDSSCKGGCEYPDVMVMQDITTVDLDMFEDWCNEAHLSFDGIKVLRTDTNANWTLKELIHEVTLEHETIGKLSELQNAVNGLMTVNVGKLPASLKMSYNQLIMEVMGVMNREASVNEINSCLNKVNDFLRKCS